MTRCPVCRSEDVRVGRPMNRYAAVTRYVSVTCSCCGLPFENRVRPGPNPRRCPQCRTRCPREAPCVPYLPPPTEGERLDQEEARA